MVAPTTAAPDTAGGPEAHVADDNHGVSRVELLWDLVFVFAVTQVSTLLSG
jgi:low temperature requirement protein LtrA